MKREANFQITFNHWLKGVCKHKFVFKLPDCGYQNPFDVFSIDKDGKFFAWELKQTQTNSISFLSVVPHQVTALEQVDGYVVIRYPYAFYIIRIDIWKKEDDNSVRRSLNEARAKEIAEFSVRL